jgi:hypothetical protein
MDFICTWLQDKTVVMPCHQLHFLHHADLIVCLDGMTIREQGSFSGLLSSDGTFAALMKTQGAAGDKHSDPPSTEDKSGLTSRPDVQSDADMLVSLKGTGKAGGLMQDEDRQKGKISKEVRVVVGFASAGVFVSLGSAHCEFFRFYSSDCYS